MNADQLVLKTKLEPPMVDSQVLFRPSVMKRLKHANKRPLTLVQAGPGFGKSTALSAFLRMENNPFVWYTVTEHDNHLSRFLLYFKEAILTLAPKLDEKWLTESFVNIQRGDERAIYECCAHFINACVEIKEDWLFIIDDYQLVGENKEINQFMKWFLMHLPQRLHMVILSRTKIDWEFLPSLRVKGQLVEINERELCFSPEEIQILFEDHYGRSLSAEDADTIFEKTEGWIMAIQMVWQRLEEANTLEEIFRDEAASMEELFEYLALDVLEKQAPPIRRFLLESSIFPLLNSEICENLISRGSDGEDYLRIVRKKHLFLHTTKDKQAYRYHALFQNFLQNKLKLDKDRWLSLHEQASAYYEKKGMLEEALRLTEKAASTEKLCQFIHKHGRDLIAQGNSQVLEAVIDGLKDVEMAAFSRLWIVKGDLERYRSKYELAIHNYQRAEALAEAENDAVSRSMALEGIARVYLDTIQPRHAQDYLKKSIAILEDEYLSGAPPEDKKEMEKQLRQLYVSMSENTINLGDAEEAQRWFEKSRHLQLGEVEADLEARLLLRTGRLGEMIRRLERRKRGMKELGKRENRPPNSHRETDLLLSYVYSLTGRGKEAKEYASEAIMQGVKAQAPFVEACGWMRLGHATQLQEKYEQRLASTCYQTALEMMEEMNISRGKAEPYMGLSLLYGKKRALEPAIKYAKLGLAETEKVDDRWLSTWIHICEAVAYIYANHDQEALAVLDKCHEQFLLCGDSYGLTVTTLWQAFVSYRMEDETRFYPYVHHFLQLVEKEGYDELLQKPTLFGPVDVQQMSPMLLDAYHHRNQEQPFLHHLMLQLGVDEGRTTHPGYTLRIQTFKEFKVFRGEEEITERDWKRGKAKELLQLFVTKRKHLLQKDEIYDLLWENQDEEVATRDFKVALNTLNKVLEPDRVARSTPFFIQRHERAYGLNLAAPFQLDAAEFERSVMKGLEAKDSEEAVLLLTQGLELYEGDYLPERMHEDWCIEERERLQVLFLRGAEKLAQLYLQAGEFDLSIEATERILEKDRCWEEAYRLLMEAYHQKQNQAMVFYYYEKCKDVLGKELGVEPMEKTQDLFEAIAQKGRSLPS